MTSNQAVFFDSVNTPFGTFRIAATQSGLLKIDYRKRFRNVIRPRKLPKRVRRDLSNCRVFLRNCFVGRPYRPKDISIDWSQMTSFDRLVLNAVRNIPCGQTISYEGLARKIKKPRAARAVGNALNRNPLPVLIPCHRVLRKDGTLGGYRGGVRIKRLLLRLERPSGLNEDLTR